MAAVFRRRLSQVSLGVVVGAAVVGAAAVFLAGYRPDEPWAYAGGLSLLVAYAAFMLGVCLLACIMPTRRALRVEPTEAMRAE